MLKRIRIMGILNVTPDSFHDGGRYFSVERAIDRAFCMKNEGADIIDIGGESTRPGSRPVTASEQIDRICPVIESISGSIGIPLSVDTTSSEVAGAACRSGASIINDISGATFDPAILDVAARNSSYIVLMHIKGTPEIMQVNPQYRDLLPDIRDFLSGAVTRADRAGIARDRIILDPGIGFGKNLEDNYRIINHLKYFSEMGYPLLVGLSRKSLIGGLYSGDADRLPATIALNMIAVRNGADIIRVHDVREHRLALDSIEMLDKVS